MKLTILLLSVIFVVSAEANEPNVKKAFKDNEIVPDVVSEPPTTLLGVAYKNDKKVDLGTEIAPKDVREEPQITYKADADNFYTIIMTDPDAPSRKNPIRREWRHWHVVNIPGDQVKDGEVLAEYVGAGPPKDTGLHRYIFLLYKQPKKLEFDEPHKSNKDGNRGHFSAEKFAKKYGLEGPIAGNYFIAQYDDSVPDLHKQFQKQ